jgi:hypothetical protein
MAQEGEGTENQGPSSQALVCNDVREENNLALTLVQAREAANRHEAQVVQNTFTSCFCEIMFCRRQADYIIGRPDVMPRGSFSICGQHMEEMLKNLPDGLSQYVLGHPIDQQDKSQPGPSDNLTVEVVEECAGVGEWLPSGQIQKQFGVPESTLRSWVKVGRIHPVFDPTRGCNVYDPKEIRAAKLSYSNRGRKRR